MIDPEGQILRELADPQMRVADVALTYAFCLRQADEVDFGRVNRAIMERWSLSALKRVKTEAWRRVHG